MPPDDPIQPLRDALALSPDNLPLRQHLARTLLGLGRFDEAERELRESLSQHPEDGDLRLLLATVYSRQGKTSQAMVVVEDLVKRSGTHAAAQVLYARLLMRAGDIPNAVAHYKLGLEADPDAADADLAEQLGVVPEEAAGEVFEGRVRQSYQRDPGPRDVEIERPTISFKDVGGMAALKEEISLKIIYPLQHAEIYRAYGKPIGGGILMYGPPGCGKTHLARATAGEIQARFLSIGINDVLEMWIGNSERNLHAIFEQARENSPCVLFFDEVDALGARRSDMASGGGRQLINQFLAEMDGLGGANDGVLILAATNAPWHVDPAFRRPGRFDRILFVPPPDAPARADILRIHLVGKPVETIDFDRLAKKCDGFSGADLRAVVDKAVERKIAEAMRLGRPKPLSSSDLLGAAGQLKPTTREWFATARNYALYSNQGGLYDDVLKYMKLL